MAVYSTFDGTKDECIEYSSTPEIMSEEESSNWATTRGSVNRVNVAIIPMDEIHLLAGHFSLAPYHMYPSNMQRALL